jgi:hypothetical protein
MVRDDPARPDAVGLERSSVRREDSLSLALARGGGFVARFTPR